MVPYPFIIIWKRHSISGISRIPVPEKEKKREANVLNAYRYSDFCQGNNAKYKIAILANEMESVTSEQEIRNQIHIMIELLEDDLETQSVIRDLFDKIKHTKDIEVLSQFLNCLIEKDYQTLFDNIQ